MESVVDAVLSAYAEREPDRARLLLHPYLHWTGPDGVTTRGRVKVMDRLADDPPTGPPRAVELRDGQIYRWQS